MPRETYVLRDGKAVPKHLAGPPPRGPASALPRPTVIGDTCEFRNMATGKMVTSKARYRAELRAMGLTEVGNEPLSRSATQAYRPEGIAEDVKRALAQSGA